MGSTTIQHVKCRITSGRGTRLHFYHTPVKINLCPNIEWLEVPCFTGEEAVIWH